MGKLLLLILVGVLIYVFWSRAAAARASKARGTAAPREATMIRCARCGLHLPADEGVAGDGKVYCCEEHRRLDRP